MTAAAQQAVRDKAAESQRRAADPLASAWVSANAGSGKTRVLIDRVARLLLAGAEPSRILCITYTKAAASEMSGRLFARLGEWSTSSDEKLEAALRELGAEQPREKLSEARRLFARALETPGGLKIETIHAFCQRVLQRFPVEANVPPDFEVIDEREAQMLLKEARAELFASLKEGAFLPLAEAIALLLELQGQSNFGRIIEEGIQDRLKIEAFLEHAGDQARRLVRAKLGLKPQDTLQSIEADCLSDPNCAEAMLRDYAQTLLRGTAAERERAKVLLTFYEQKHSAHFEPYEEQFFIKSGKQRSIKSTKTTGARWAEFEPLLNGEFERLRVWRMKRRALDAAAQTEAALEVLRHILAGYERLKQMRGALDYDDLVEKTRILLKESANAWVHYKLDGGIDHVLIDEAQDTSPDQWEIVQALTVEFFAQEARATQRRRSVFAVGDEKQSIYSFQGADPRKFAEMRTLFGAAVTASGRAWSPTELEVSFRSVPEILRAVDVAFAGEDARAALTAGANAVRHEAERIGEQGLVELWPGEQRVTQSLAAHEDWRLPVDERPQTAPEIALTNKIAKQIRSWLNEGTPVPTKSGGSARAIEEGDVLILVRQRGGQYYEMLRALMREGLNVAGSDRLVLRDAMAFRDLDALGRFCLVPEDDLALAEVLKGPFLGLTDDDLLTIAPKRNGSLWRALSEATSAPFGVAREWLRKAIHLSRMLRPFEFYQRMLYEGPADESPRRAFVERLGLEAEDAIGEFLSLALSFEREGASTLQGFLAYAMENAESIKRDMEEAQGRIRVMTVHGAKGLEAPIVFLIDTCTVPRPPSGKWLLGEAKEEAPLIRLNKDQREDVSEALTVREKERQDQEYLRQLYVAMTRAKDHLYIAGVRPARQGYPGSWHDALSRALDTLPDIEREETEHGVLLRLGREASGEALRAAKPALVHALPAWAQRPAQRELPIARRTPSALLPAEEEAAQPAVFSPSPGARDPYLRGRVIHKLLQLLPELAPAARPPAARRLFTLANYRALADSRDEIIREVTSLLDASDFARVFGPGSRAEVAVSGALTTASGRPLLISGQIDRLLVTDNEILIVDFKTNRPPPKTAADVPRAYINQMAAYARLLNEALPGRQINAALLYTAAPRLISLDLAAIDVTQITADPPKQ